MALRVRIHAAGLLCRLLGAAFYPAVAQRCGLAGDGGAGHHLQHGAAVEFGRARRNFRLQRFALSLLIQIFFEIGAIVCRHRFFGAEIFFDVGAGREVTARLRRSDGEVRIFGTIPDDGFLHLFGHIEAPRRAEGKQNSKEGCQTHLVKSILRAVCDTVEINGPAFSRRIEDASIA